MDMVAFALRNNRYLHGQNLYRLILTAAVECVLPPLLDQHDWYVKVPHT